MQGSQTKIEVDLDRIRPLKKQPREHFDLDKMKRLAASLKAVKQRKPATARRLPPGDSHEFALIDGERRWRACRMAGISTLWIVIDEDVLDDEQHFEISAISNFCRENLSHLESARIVGWLEQKRGYGVEEIADRLGCTTGWVYQLQAILRLSPEVQKLMDPSIPEKKRLSVTIAYELAKRVPSDRPELQNELAHFMLTHKVRSAQAKALIERKTKGLGTAPKSRAPRADKAYGSFLTFLDRLEADTDELMRTPVTELERILATKDPATIRMAVASLRKSASRLGKFAERLEGIRK